MTAHSLTPSSDVEASQDQHTDTSIGLEPTPAAQNGNSLTTQRDSLNMLGLSSADMANLQQNDDTFIRDIYLYLCDGTLPDLQKEAKHERYYYKSRTFFSLTMCYFILMLQKQNVPKT